MNPQLPIDDEELENLHRHEKLRKKYHKMGVPVGYGIPPTSPPSPEEIREEQQLRQMEAAEDQEIEDGMAMNSPQTDYQTRMVPGDKAQIVKFINEVTPFKHKLRHNEDGTITQVVEEGVAPMEAFMYYAPWLHAVDGLSFLDEREINVREIDLDLYDMEVMFCLDRAHYGPEMNMYCSGLKGVASLKIRNNRDALGMHMASAEVIDTTQNVNVRRRNRSRLGNVIDRVRGAGE